MAPVAWLKLQTSLNYNESKTAWNRAPKNHGARDIPPPLPKGSILNKTWNAVVRDVAQIHTDHWISSVFLKRIRK